MSVDLMKCPNCGAYPLFVASAEKLSGIAHIHITDEGDGCAAAWSGDTSVLWDEQRTLGYFCLDCQEYLPEDYQKELDRLLGNTRERA